MTMKVIFNKILKPSKIKTQCYKMEGNLHIQLTAQSKNNDSPFYAKKKAEI